METTVQAVSPIVPQAVAEAGVPLRPQSVSLSRTAKWPVGAVGPVVLDTVVTHVDHAPATSKRECQMSDSWGGGALNVSRAVSSYGGGAVPCFLIGRDAAGEAMKADLGDEFPQARFVPGYSHSRRSHLRPDGVTETTRPPLAQRRLPSYLHDAISRTPVTVVSPLAAADGEFAADALGAARCGIWQPSLPQLVDADSLRRLLPLATVTVLNHDEARAATGYDEPMDAIMALCDAGARGVIVTSRDGALARIDGTWEFAPAHQVQARRTSRAGDVFTGVFALARASGRTTRESLQLGQAAAARHVTGAPPLASLDELAVWAHGEPKVKLARRIAEPLNIRRAVSVAVATAATILAIAVLR